MINTVKEKIRLLSQNKKAVVGGGVFLLMLIALPVALLLVNQNQDNRQQAAGTGTETKFTADLTPNVNIVKTTNPPQILKGAPFEIKLLFSAKGKNVINLRTKINYDVTKFTLNSVDTTGTAFQTVNSNTTVAGSAIILAEMNPTSPLTTDNQLLATLKFTATNNAAQLGTGTMFLSDPTEVTQQNPGGTITSLLTYETEPVTYAVVASLPAVTQTITNTPTATKTPTGTQLPITVNTLTATNITSTSAKLQGTYSSQGKSVNLYFKFSTTNGACSSLGTNTAITTGISNSTTAFTRNVSGLTANTTYYNCLVAKENNIGTLTYGAVTSFTTAANASVTGTAPTTVTPTKSPTPTQPNATAPATSTVTSTPSIVVSPGVNEASVNIAVRLPGIGNNNNGASNLGENNNPRHERSFDVYLFSQGNAEVKKIPTTFIYADGKYTGTTMINGVPLNVPYIIKIRTDNSLLKNLGFITPESGKTYSLDATAPDKRIAVGKLSSVNSSNALGIEDYQAFTNCLDELPICTTEFRKRADLNDDGIINLKDRSILIRSFVNIQGD